MRGRLPEHYLETDPYPSQTGSHFYSYQLNLTFLQPLQEQSHAQMNVPLKLHGPAQYLILPLFLIHIFVKNLCM